MSGTGKPRSKRKSMPPRRVICNTDTSPEDDGEERRREVRYSSAQKDDGERQQDMQQVECDAISPDQSASSSTQPKDNDDEFKTHGMMGHDEGGANSDEASVSGARSLRVEMDASAKDDFDDSASGERRLRDRADVDAGSSDLFKSNTDLTYYKTRRNGGPFVCDICEKRFSQKHNLKDHKRVHSNYRPYPCDLCEKKFKTKVDLIRHESRHKDDRPHACNICKKKFKTKVDLIRHEMRHKDDLPHSCNICKKKFKLKDDLRKHQKRHVDNRHKPTTLENSGLRRRLF